MNGKKVYNLVLGVNDLACIVEALSVSQTDRSKKLLGKIADYIDALNDNKPYVWEVEE